MMRILHVYSTAKSQMVLKKLKLRNKNDDNIAFLQYSKNQQVS